MAHIVYTRFTSNDTKDGTKYSLGGLYVRPIITLVSSDALKLIKKKNREAIVPGKGIDYAKLKVSVAGVTREHVIPVEALYQHLDDMGDRLTERIIRKMMPKLEIAIITKDQNQKLKEAGLNSAMPEGWWQRKNLDPLERYRCANLLDSIWAKEF